MIALAVANTCRSDDVDKPWFYVEMSDGWMRVYSIGEPHWVARVKTKDWAKALQRPVPVTKDDRRHFALNLIAAAIAGDDGSREHSTDPNIRMVTLEEARKNGQPSTATIERGTCFGILRDSDPKAEVYRADIIMFPLPERQPFKSNEGGAVALS